MSANQDIVFFCSQCGQKIAAPESIAGKSLPCPKCGGSLTVPSGDGFAKREARPAPLTLKPPAAPPPAPEPPAEQPRDPEPPPAVLPAPAPRTPTTRIAPARPTPPAFLRPPPPPPPPPPPAEPEPPAEQETLAEPELPAEELEVTENDMTFDCPHCDWLLIVDKRGAGRLVSCPGCGNPVTVPFPEGEPADVLEVEPVPDEGFPAEPDPRQPAE